MSPDPLETALLTPFDLAGKRILVTGATGGIGRATAEVCQGQGAEMFLTDIVSHEQARERIDGLVGAERYAQADLSSRSAVEALREKVGSVWAVIDAAGICPVDDWLAEQWDREFDRVIDVNLRGPLNLARAFMPAMIDQGGGRFAFCGSLSGEMGGVVCGPHYAASKGGLHAFVRWLAQKGTAHNVLANAVAPGSIATPMAKLNRVDVSGYPQGRGGHPKEIGATLAFLCMPGAGFISGALIDANGGTYFR